VNRGAHSDDDGHLAARTDAELIAQLLGGGAPSAGVVECAARMAAVPLWERRLLGVGALMRDHKVTPDRALRLAALWELAERWVPDDRPSVTSPREAVLLLGGLRLLER